MSHQVIPDQGLGSTAHWTAAIRARESAREDRLFADPWAAALAGEEGEAWIAGRSDNSVIPIVLRTRFFDDFLQQVTGQHQIRQVVLMAAGLDTRAFRLRWPEPTHLFELDQPAILLYKDQILHSAGATPACVRHTIGIDLTAPWQDALVRAGFDPERPSAWLLEGFLFYIASEAIIQLLEDVTRLAAQGSWLGFDIVNSVALTSPLTRPWIDMQARAGAPWIGVMDDPAAFLTSRGWQATLTQAGQPDANHGRWPFPVIPTKMPDMPHNWFVIAQKTPPTP
jgi:methyltransferase (TIGR00027 family)